MKWGNVLAACIRVDSSRSSNMDLVQCGYYVEMLGQLVILSSVRFVSPVVRSVSELSLTLSPRVTEPDCVENSTLISESTSVYLCGYLFVEICYRTSEIFAVIWGYFAP